MGPILATIALKPSAVFLTTVGYSSLVYKYIVANEAPAPNRTRDISKVDCKVLKLWKKCFRKGYKNESTAELQQSKIIAFRLPK